LTDDAYEFLYKAQMFERLGIEIDRAYYTQIEA
jgi:hypothetical protein